MSPDMSRSRAKLALPMIRLASIRPATRNPPVRRPVRHVLIAIGRVQFRRQRIAAEIGGIGVAALAQLVKLSGGAGRSVCFHRGALLKWGILVFRDMHDENPFFEQGNRLQPTLQAGLDKLIQIAIQHRWVLPVSTPVRKSLMRD
jgi:hypothetical protein